jgi:hypothetical protein
MLGFLGGLARSIWGGLVGAFDTLWHGATWLANRLFWWFDFIGSLVGFMPEKKLRVRVSILLDANLQPLVSRRDVEAIVELAKQVFSNQANVTLVSPSGSDQFIVAIEPDLPPAYVLEPHCDAEGYREVFTRVGTWFRLHSAVSATGIIGSGQPATMFCVEQVNGEDRGGCWPWVFADYGYIGKALPLATDRGTLLGLAHELGHACDLPHGQGSLMDHAPGSRSGSLSRLQIATLRSSPRVTYW